MFKKLVRIITPFTSFSPVSMSSSGFLLTPTKTSCSPIFTGSQSLIVITKTQTPKTTTSVVLTFLIIPPITSTIPSIP